MFVGRKRILKIFSGMKPGGDVGVSPGTAVTGNFAFEGGERVQDSAAFAKTVLTAHTAAMNRQLTGHNIAIEIGGSTPNPSP